MVLRPAGGPAVCTYGVYERSRAQRRYARDHLVTRASSATSLCGGVVWSSRGRRLQQEIEVGKRGIRSVSSPRRHWDGRRARRRLGGDGMVVTISAARGRGRRSWRHPGILAPSILVRRRRGTRRGVLAHRRGEGSTVAVANGIGDDELRSGACGERAEEGRAFEKVRGGQGGCVASPGGRGSEQGGRRRWKQEVPAARLCVRHA